MPKLLKFPEPKSGLCKRCGRPTGYYSSLLGAPSQDRGGSYSWHFETCEKMPEIERKRLWRILQFAERFAKIPKEQRTKFVPKRDV